jgi:hypothetical protein
MSDGHSRQDSRLGEVAHWHPTEGSPEQVGAGCAIEATTIETYGFLSSSRPEAN